MIRIMGLPEGIGQNNVPLLTPQNATIAAYTQVTRAFKRRRVRAQHRPVKCDPANPTRPATRQRSLLIKSRIDIRV